MLKTDSRPIIKESRKSYYKRHSRDSTMEKDHWKKTHKTIVIMLLQRDMFSTSF